MSIKTNQNKFKQVPLGVKQFGAVPLNSVPYLPLKGTILVPRVVIQLQITKSPTKMIHSQKGQK